MTFTLGKRSRGESNFGPTGGSEFYIVRSDNPDADAPNLNAVRAWVETQVDAEIAGYAIQGAQVSELMRRPGLGAWVAEVRYGAGVGFAAIDPGKYRSFSGSLATETLYRSYSVVASGGSGGSDAPDRAGLINVNAEGRAEGAEIERPVYQLGFSAVLPKDEVENPGGYAEQWLVALGTVNASAWKGYPPGSLLFETLSSEQGPSGYTVRAGMSLRLPELSVQIGDGMVLPVLEGWDFLEIVSAIGFDATLGVYFSSPEFFYVHRLYKRVAWGTLGL